ncbi:KedN5 family methylcobalamin-dependent radical SAM C-methyltransferase [Actinokineospora sp. UTMC 2448]|uniref:KedN5 family methylcobalamin-dependent radical SAM C-methyltransferase n=1 Tax=Actinokineospora sp. UTMC 2448 TaxID=2268449 RepID=UPI002164618B|nr:KedN5 family methylcobalamin-dependent radical SAM C-methyltransferase [Actinokineospora sp. UTMC 2448]UVS78761.1 hopanoid biosynthesis associated radical SAM protein HpnJ [Actinokineospora sp. UTMC 2448]
MPNSKQTVVHLVQQGIWNTPLESMPLAQGYMKAAALADERIRRSMDIQIHNYRGGLALSEMANRQFSGGVPDIMAFSVLGWNYRAFGALAETFKQLNPNGWVVFGGTHVAHQGERVFRMFPDVDVIVDGEGEPVFPDILRAYLDGVPRTDLAHIPGLTYRDARGAPATTAPRPRIENLDEIPSPFLTGALELTDDAGQFRYDVAIMETNRGCPYKCAFCYWGGATGQKVRAFSRERLRAELELFAKLRVHTIVLCDANFGLLPADIAFIDDVIELRETYGYPRAIETSWAKNKSKTFYEIVRKMKQAGMHSSFTLALQTLDDATLSFMNRRNMKVNEWEELTEWLSKEGMDCYAELIWGAPGETVESFMEGYDRLTKRVSRIACYPMLMLPNTDYSEKKAEYGIISVRGDTDDFEYMLATNTVTFQENQRMQRFLYWARVLAEMCVFRHIWVGLRELAGFSQSRVLQDIGGYIEESDDPVAEMLREDMASAIGGTGDLGGGVALFFTDPRARQLLRRWWAESIHPTLPRDVAPVLDEIFRFDLLIHPIHPGMDSDGSGIDLPVVSVRGGEYYVRSGVPLAYDIPALLADLRADRRPDLSSNPTIVDLYYRTGSENAVTSTNHEVIIHYMGMTTEEVMANAAVRAEADMVPVAAPQGGCG